VFPPFDDADFAKHAPTPAATVRSVTSPQAIIASSNKSTEHASVLLPPAAPAARQP
jgi:hypothetical protein